MKIAVITPYHELGSMYLEQCLHSVNEQSHDDIIHVIIGDGCDVSNHLNLNKFNNVHNIPLPKNINDYGDTPRTIGVAYAFSIGADAVAFLDSDNWFEKKHIEFLVNELNDTKSDVVCSLRYICNLEGEVMGVCPDSDGLTFCDTNCLLVTKNLKNIIGSWWLIPDDLHAIDDRVIWDRLIQSTNKISCNQKVTSYYRSAFIRDYLIFGKEIPKEAKAGDEIRELQSTMNKLARRAVAKFKER